MLEENRATYNCVAVINNNTNILIVPQINYCEGTLSLVL